MILDIVNTIARYCDTPTYMTLKNIVPNLDDLKEYFLDSVWVTVNGMHSITICINKKYYRLDTRTLIQDEIKSIYDQYSNIKEISSMETFDNIVDCKEGLCLINYDRDRFCILNNAFKLDHDYYIQDSILYKSNGEKIVLEKGTITSISTNPLQYTLGEYPNRVFTNDSIMVPYFNYYKLFDSIQSKNNDGKKLSHYWYMDIEGNIRYAIDYGYKWSDKIILNIFETRLN